MVWNETSCKLAPQFQCPIGHPDGAKQRRPTEPPHPPSSKMTAALDSWRDMRFSSISVKVGREECAYQTRPRFPSLSLSVSVRLCLSLSVCLSLSRPLVVVA